MSDNPKHRGSTFWFITAVLSLPLLYVLSTGPIGYLHDEGFIDEPYSRLFAMSYMPLWWLCEVCEPFSLALDWYLRDLWGSPGLLADRALQINDPALQC